ncbi:unnamed protein product [Brassica oleracea var. botrytis]
MCILTGWCDRGKIPSPRCCEMDKKDRRKPFPALWSSTKKASL